MARTTVQLVYSDGRSSLTGNHTFTGDGVREPLTRAERKAVFERPDEVIDAAEALVDPTPVAAVVGTAQSETPSAQGHARPAPDTGEGDASRRRPGAELATLRGSLREHQSIMLDTTTIRNALCAVDGARPPQASELLDLNALTVAAACFEQVVIQPDVVAYSETHDGRTWLSKPDLPPSATDWLVPLPLTDVQRKDLDSVYAQAYTRVTDPRQASRWVADWARFFKRDPKDVPIKLEDFLGWHAEPFTNAAELESLFWGADPLSDHPEVAAFLGVQTCRTYYNDMVAGELRVPYVASALRTPVYKQLGSSKLPLLNLIGRLLPAVGEPKPKQARRSQQTKVPFLLGRVLAKINSPDEYWVEIKNLREACRPFRDLLRRSDRPKPDALAAELQKCADSYFNKTDLAHAVLTFGLDAASGNPAAASAGIKLIAAVKNIPQLREWLLNRRHPGLYPLLMMATDAASIKSLQEQVTGVWGRRLEPHVEEDLVHIGNNQAYLFQHPARTV